LANGKPAGRREQTTRRPTTPTTTRLAAVLTQAWLTCTRAPAIGPLPALLGGPQPSSAVDGQSATVPGMPGRPIVLTATPTGAHWHIEIPGHPAITTRTLAMAEAMTARRLHDVFDLQVDLGGLEDLCADAVDLGQAADAAHITALKLRRVAVRTLKDAGCTHVDIGYLTGIPTETVDNLLRVPVETPWMTTGTTPWRRRPRLHDPPPSGGTRRVVAAMVTPAGSSWDLHLAGDVPPRRVRTLAAAENALTAAAAASDGGVDVLVIPKLDETCRRHIDEADTATAAADDLNERCYLLRLEVAHRLRALELGYRDIGYLLDMHEHRVRLLLTDPAA